MVIMLKNLLFVVQLLILCQISPTWALEPDEADQSEPVDLVDTSGQDNHPLDTVTSMDAYSNIGEQTATSLQFAAKYAAKNGHYDKAIRLCQLALDKDYNDMDVHMTYAGALEDKLDGQREKDHELLNKCVREWLIVYRTEVGDEKSLSFHGINPLGHFYEDEDRSMPARAHLVTLTGRAPKPWETDDKYLKWVNRPTTAVAGQLLSTKASNNTK